mmetsp:Transcript_29337/g.71500  ORF Transcript_29337/g.71500 Transcript_29337/m.71500 type:complete len:460 (+) Transcript_29337:2-1381(+)
MWLHASSKQAHPRAQFELGELFHVGEGVSVDKELSRYWLTESARNYDLDAMNRLALIHLTGDGCKPAVHVAESWLRRVVRQTRSPKSMYILARFYADLVNKSKDDCNQTADLHTISISFDNEESNATSVLPSYRSVFRTPRRRALKRDPTDPFLGLSKYEDDMGDDDLELMETILNEGSEDELIEKDEQSSLIGIIYQNDRVVRVIPNSQADEKGVQPGWRIVKIGGIPPNTADTKAITDLFKRCKEWNRSVEVLFEQSRSINSLQNRTLFWMEAAAEMDSLEAQWTLSNWFLPVRYKKNSEAAELAGFRLLSDVMTEPNEATIIGVIQNLTASNMWLQRAASQRDITAWHEMGRRAFENANGAQLPSARDCLERAARTGHVGSMVILGHLYAEGLGGVDTKDEATAVDWWLKAAEAGNNFAGEALKRHEGYLPLNLSHETQMLISCRKFTRNLEVRIK